MKVSIDQDFLKGLHFWVIHDRKIALRIFKLMDDINRSPFKGIGKPEPLRHGVSNLWSRRITNEHRIIYKVKSDEIQYLQCRFHY